MSFPIPRFNIISPTLFKKFITNVQLGIEGHGIRSQYKLFTALHLIRKLMNQWLPNHEMLPNNKENSNIKNQQRTYDKQIEHILRKGTE